MSDISLVSFVQSRGITITSATFDKHGNVDSVTTFTGYTIERGGKTLIVKNGEHYVDTYMFENTIKHWREEADRLTRQAEEARQRADDAEKVLALKASAQ